MSSAIFVTPGKPESNSPKTLSNRSPALHSPIARMLNTKTPSGVSIAVRSLDRASIGKWKKPFVASKTLKCFTSLSK